MTFTLGPLLLSALLTACSGGNPYYDRVRPHHRPDGFNNRYIDNHDGSQPSVWRWQWQRWRTGLVPQDPGHVPRVTPRLEYLRANRRDTTVTWIGHATMLWQINGVNILTDPVFSERASPVSFAGPRRDVPLPMTLDQLPPIDLVLISHNHYDHLDRRTVETLAHQPGGPPLFLVPLGVERWVRARGIESVHAMDWWDGYRPEGRGRGLTVHFVPAQHWSSRVPWDRDRTLWGGWVVIGTAAGRPYSMYYAGDTGYSPDFRDIGERFGGFDFAQLPVGCYEPRWFMSRQHVNEDDAARIHGDVRSRFSVGVHWGTFRLCDEPIEAPLSGLPAARAAHGIADEAFVLMALGETRVLAGAGP